MLVSREQAAHDSVGLAARWCRGLPIGAATSKWLGSCVLVRILLPLVHLLLELLCFFLVGKAEAG
jgi:hypothetical protein